MRRTQKRKSILQPTQVVNSPPKPILSATHSRISILIPSIISQLRATHFKGLIYTTPAACLLTKIKYGHAAFHPSANKRSSPNATDLHNRKRFLKPETGRIVGSKHWKSLRVLAVHSCHHTSDTCEVPSSLRLGRPSATSNPDFRT